MTNVVKVVKSLEEVISEEDYFKVIVDNLYLLKRDVDESAKGKVAAIQAELAYLRQCIGVGCRIKYLHNLQTGAYYFRAYHKNTIGYKTE